MNKVVLPGTSRSTSGSCRGTSPRELYGYRLYQGGAVPGKIIRVVEVVGLDAEACGGLHCSHTGMVEPVRIRRTHRIQDGIVRIEYTAGIAAVPRAAEGQGHRREPGGAAEHHAGQDRRERGPAVEQLRDQKKRMDQFATVYTEMKARELAGAAVMLGDTRIVVHITEGEEDPEQLSKMLSEMSNVIAVIGHCGRRAPKCSYRRAPTSTWTAGPR